MGRRPLGACLVAALVFFDRSSHAHPARLVEPLAQAGRPQPVKSGPPYRPVATVKDIMEALLEPSTEVIFDAVSPTMVGSRLEKEPATDEEWLAIRNSALVMSEAANLLMLAQRPIDVSDHGSTVGKPVERMPLIARRVSRNRARWMKLASGLFTAADVTTRAVDARDPKALLKAGDAIDAACEACHHEFWYGR